MPGDLATAPAAVKSVPAMCCPSTGMSRISFWPDIRLHDGVLGEGSDVVIDATEMHNRMWRRRLRCAIGLDTPRADGAERGVRAHGRQRGDLGPARSAASP